LRDVTATVDSIPLIAASIMSKKLAVANKVLVLDVKVGSGAFMKNLEDARSLARLMVKIGRQAGRKVTAVLSNMDEPLGEMIGNAVEVKEAIDSLKNKGPQSFMNLIKALLMAENGKLSQTEAEARVEKVLAEGLAWQKFVEMVKIQGGDVSMVEDYRKLPTARETYNLLAEKEGYVNLIHCEEIGLAAMMLGAGRETKDSVIDMAVGLKLVKHVGDQVKANETIAEVYVNPDIDNSKAIDRLKNAIKISDEKIAPQKLILDIIS
jgi:pyrimidine-nucleoside phosphorylase